MKHREKALCWLLFLLASFSGLAINQGDTTLAPKIVSRVAPLINWGIFAAMLPLIKWSRITRVQFFCVLATVAWLALRNLHVAVGASPGGGLLQALLLLEFIFIPEHIWARVLKMYRYVLIAMSAYGIVAYISFLANLGLPHDLVVYYGENTNNSMYANYYLSYILVQSDGLRLCGMFNEPGYLGTVIALLLLTERVNLKRPGNIVMFAAGCLTMSMAYWMILIVGGLLMSLRKTKHIIIAAVAMFALLFVVNNVQFEDKGINNLIERFQYDEQKGSFKGDNRRSSRYKQVEKRFSEEGNKVFGEGTNSVRLNNIGSFCSYKTYVIEWGYLGFFITYGLLLLAGYFYCRGNYRALVFLLCFALSVYQRPNVFTTTYWLILFAGILKIREGLPRAAEATEATGASDISGSSAPPCAAPGPQIPQKTIFQ
jgi:nitrogen fixation-related uncharacterized protein